MLIPSYSRISAFPDCLAVQVLLRSSAANGGKFHWPVRSANWRRSSLQTLFARGKLDRTCCLLIAGSPQESDHLKEQQHSNGSQAEAR
jgi:hypothetical protein